MDQQIEQYLNSLVDDCLSAAPFSNLSEQERTQARQTIEETLNGAIIGLLVDQLNEEQLKSLEQLNPDSPEMEAAIEDFASQIPDFASLVEQELNELVAQIKSTGQIVRSSD